jgi:hypothetical protein
LGALEPVRLGAIQGLGFTAFFVALTPIRPPRNQNLYLSGDNLSPDRYRKRGAIWLRSLSTLNLLYGEKKNKERVSKGREKYQKDLIFWNDMRS